MDDQKHSRSLFQTIFRRQPKLHFGRSEAGLPAVGRSFQLRFKSRKHRKALGVLTLIFLLLFAKLFNLDGQIKNWWADYNQQFHQPAPEPIPQGSVCHLLMALEQEQSVLLENPETIAAYRVDSLILSGLPLDSIHDPDLQNLPWAERSRSPDFADLPLPLNELVYFEALTQDRARLVFADGNSSVHQLSTVLQQIRDREKCHFFQAVSFEGKAYEYFNILYVESFEKVSCEEGAFYRARLNLGHSADPTAQALRDCGTDLFSAYVYRKVRQQLEYLNPNSDYSYREAVVGERCDCPS